MAEKNSGSGFIEKHLMPVAIKLSQFKPLIAIRDGIIVAMPMIIIGSFFMIANSFPIQGWPEWLAATSFHGVSVAAVLAKITNGSFGIMGLLGCYGVAASYADQHGTDSKSAGVIAIAAYFIVTPSVMSGDKVPLEGMPYGYLGSKGLFIAIIIGLVTGGIFQWFINHDIRIKMPEAVPPAVADSFSALIPGAVIIALFGAIYALFSWTGWGSVHDLVFNLLSKPLGLLGDTLLGTILAVGLNSLFWFVGIHGANVVNNIISPIWLMNTGANKDLAAAGHLDLAHHGHIITQPFIDNFIFMGGGGATLGLVLSMGILVLLHRSSKQIKILTPLTLTPGIFNINEPTMFGLPIVLNMNLLIPFIVVPMVNAVVTYFAMRFELVPLCTGAVVPWTMPPIISGFLATSSLAGSALQIVNLVIDVAIYFPFLSSLNKQFLLEEAGELEEK
ncbi:cellobiose-specific PTS system IIC component [Ligilactobacillus salitolerans]|uniref:Permease IIC component n=1 Tax=Ligilactobacillus salitolerans TaxID=1808352 RepID=A0A401IRM2_9LACO|nr:PTS sugar transporter subunit IIC [Ligilactobacillus salitolerans]GBG94189.1 cellobiose-specific PTS system IIC component [Ligilactobacillus salitolerans]